MRGSAGVGTYAPQHGCPGNPSAGYSRPKQLTMSPTPAGATLPGAGLGGLGQGTMGTPSVPDGMIAGATRASWLQNPLVFASLAVLLALPGLVQVFFGPDDHDVAWAVYVAGRMLHGAKLYVDILEVNPPLIFVLSIPVKLLSQMTGLSDILTFELSVLALIVVSLVACASLLRLLAPSRDDLFLRRGLFLVAVFALFAVPASSNVFAQREHILVILLLPYLLAAAARAMRLPLGRGAAIWIGLLAGIGIALKPFFVLPWVFVELYLAIELGPKRAWLRTENVIIAVLLIVYAAAVVVFTPEYLALVAILREVYGGFLPMPYTEILTDWRAIYVEHAVLAVWITRPDDRTRELRRVLLLATIGFMGALLLQHKGWEYHWYPPLAGATLLLGVALLDAVRNRETASTLGLVRRAGFVIATVGLIVMGAGVTKTVLAGLNPAPHSPYMRDLTPRMTRLIREQASGESISALSSFPAPMFPAVNYTGVRWGSRFFHLWALNGPYRDQRWSHDSVRYHRPDQMGRAERFVYNGVISDLLRDPPRLLFVLMPPDGTLPTPKFNYIRYFSQDARFVHAMRDYALIDTIGSYRVYKRMSGQRAVSSAVKRSNP